EYYDKGIIDRILTTNLVYQTPDLLERPYYINEDMSKYIALIIDNLNHDASLSDLLTHTKRINRLLAQYRSYQERDVKNKRPFSYICLPGYAAALK
ncbi:hypothetical protein NE476_31640, partial [Enterocloster bolteae]|nr:hypothetical protein [Enterocloster bolteae]